jgi:hypothetical protein
MTRTVMQDLNKWRKTFNRYDMSVIPGKPGGRDKGNRIYSGLNSRFADGGIYIREHHYDLINEIVKFGAKMAHDDTIESLFYACQYAYPPVFSGREMETGKYIKKRRVPKSWILA